MICLAAGLHQMWQTGIFDYNEDRTELEIEFFWQPACPHGIDDRVPLSTLPHSSRDLDGVRYVDGRPPVTSSFLNANTVERRSRAFCRDIVARWCYDNGGRRPLCITVDSKLIVS
jgi:hypothetical protein